MKIFELVIATAAFAVPFSVAAQDAAEPSPADAAAALAAPQTPDAIAAAVTDMSQAEPVPSAPLSPDATAGTPETVAEAGAVAENAPRENDGFEELAMMVLREGTPVTERAPAETIETPAAQGALGVGTLTESAPPEETEEAQAARSGAGAGVEGPINVPEERLEAVTTDSAVSQRTPDVVIDMPSPGALVTPDARKVPLPEDVVTDQEAAAAEAVADDPTAAFEERPMVDPNEVACLGLLGAPDAGVPASQSAAADKRAAMVSAVDVCAAAAGGRDPDPTVLFHAAEIALAKRDAARAFELFEESAAGDVGAADTKLGDFYLFGAAPGGRNIEKAVDYYEKATALGDPAGMTSLAMLYRAATGVPQDPARMVDLLTAAADKGYHFAALRLAQTYLNGDGIPGRADPALGIPDGARASQWYTRAADEGNIEAALELAALYADPASGVPADPAEQVRLTRMAADSGLPAAVAALGVLYETGQGVAKDPEEAARLYVRAMETGEVAFGDLRKGAPTREDWDEDTAKAFQTILTERGLYDSYVDGLIGAGTQAAAEALATGGGAAAAN